MQQIYLFIYSFILIYAFLCNDNALTIAENRTNLEPTVLCHRITKHLFIYLFIFMWKPQWGFYNNSPKLQNIKPEILSLTNGLTPYILQACLCWSCINCSVSKRNKYQEYFLGVKGVWCVCPDNFNTMCQFSWDLGPSNTWNTQGLSWPVGRQLCLNLYKVTTARKVPGYVFIMIILKCIIYTLNKKKSELDYTGPG